MDVITVSNEGERILEGHDSPQLLRSHLQRYELAARYLRPDSRVLDCACGSGYGSHYLASRAGEVIGVDLSQVALDYCRAQYRAPNLSFLQGSAEALPFNDASFDFFCSLETIEHIPHPEKLVAEARRVLKPGGRFLVSTPNRLVSGLASGQRPSNPFHLFEWSLKEFDACLRNEFTKVSYFGQRVRSRNKLHGPYVSSKLKRFLGRPDLVSIRAHSIQQMETWRSWQPENFIAVCENPPYST